MSRVFLGNIHIVFFFVLSLLGVVPWCLQEELGICLIFQQFFSVFFYQLMAKVRNELSPSLNCSQMNCLFYFPNIFALFVTQDNDIKNQVLNYLDTHLLLPIHHELHRLYQVYMVFHNSWN